MLGREQRAYFNLGYGIADFGLNSHGAESLGQIAKGLAQRVGSRGQRVGGSEHSAEGIGREA